MYLCRTFRISGSGAGHPEGDSTSLPQPQRAIAVLGQDGSD